MITGARGEVWRFGKCAFDEAEGRLWVEGRAVILDRNSLGILSVLLHHAGTEVDKARLLEAGWPNRIVHENSLAKAIGRLRQLLGDERELLETVYGYGYKLNVEPRLPVVSAEAAPTTGEPRGDRVVSAWERRRALTLGAAALLTVAVIGSVHLLNRSNDDAGTSFRTTPPLTGDAPDAVGRLLWVDDHPQNNIYEKRFFEDRRIAVHNVTSSADALRLLAMYDYDVVISDMGRGEDRLAGLRLASQMRARGERTPLIIYTVRPDGAEAQQAQRELVAEAGAQAVVLTPEEVRSVILKLFRELEARSPD